MKNILKITLDREILLCCMPIAPNAQRVGKGSRPKQNLKLVQSEFNIGHPIR